VQQRLTFLDLALPLHVVELLKKCSYVGTFNMTSYLLTAGFTGLRSRLRNQRSRVQIPVAVFVMNNSMPPMNTTVSPIPNYGS
jgi:hypothetical protein